jgi:hypothetical protein
VQARSTVERSYHQNVNRVSQKGPEEHKGIQDQNDDRFDDEFNFF